MKILGIIPARYASSRFEGKPLARINGKTMICRVAERASKAKGLQRIVVATDDQRIADEVERNGFTAVMTSNQHLNGTSRCEEVTQLLNEDYNAIVNIQGDEPFISTEQIELVTNLIAKDSTDIATLVKVINDNNELMSNNTVKAVINNNGYALYFSRQAIPFLRGIPQEEWLNKHTFYKHIGIYAYKTHILRQLVTLKPTALETAESLEQLRWLENGFNILTATTTHENIAIDTPADLVKAETFARNHNL